MSENLSEGSSTPLWSERQLERAELRAERFRHKNLDELFASSPGTFERLQQQATEAGVKNPTEFLQTTLQRLSGKDLLSTPLSLISQQVAYFLESNIAGSEAGPDE